MIRTDGSTSALTEEQKMRILDGIRSGQSLASVLRDNDDLPGARAINALRRKDAQFAADFEAARVEGLETNADEALDFAYAVRGNKALTVAASKYASTVTQIAAALAPKRFGTMLKVAGADGEKLSVALVNYSEPAPHALEAESVPVPALCDSEKNDG
jgi:hypothetical protein